MTTQEQATLAAVEFAKRSEAGVTAIKVELEAQLDRGQHSHRDECSDCDGTGHTTCDECEGEYQPQCDCHDDDCEERHDYCDSCDGGEMRCENCDGEGVDPDSEGDFASDKFCHEYLMGKLADLGLARLHEDRNSVCLSHGVETDWHPDGAMTYGEFYNDRSVDSEFTFTLLLNDTETVLLLPKILTIWRDFCVEVNPDFNVDGAGMHLAWLSDFKGRYPIHDRSDDELVRYGNFAKSMGLLMPALYFLATPNGTSRDMHFRRPGCTSDGEAHGSTKFFAINYAGGAIEYRIFDTCYDNPNTILDDVQVMARTLRYWTVEYTPTGMGRIVRRIKFGKEYGRGNISRYYITAAHIDLLNAGLERLKPKYLTIGQLKQQRGFTVTKHTFLEQRKKAEADAQILYEEYTERYEWNAATERLRAEADAREHFNPGASQEEIERLTKVALSNRISKRLDKSEYISDRLRRWESDQNNGSQYTLSA